MMVGRARPAHQFVLFVFMFAYYDWHVGVMEDIVANTA